MEPYDYQRTGKTKTAAGLGSESMWGVLELWLAQMIKQAEGAIPKNLKLDGVRWTPMRRGYASVEAKGYSKGDLEATSTIAILLDHNSCGATVNLWYKDASLIGDVNTDFHVEANDSPQSILQKINSFFANR